MARRIARGTSDSASLLGRTREGPWLCSLATAQSWKKLRIGVPIHVIR